MVRFCVAQAFFTDAAARNADGGNAKSAADIGFLHAVADDEGVGREVAAFEHEIGEPFLLAGGIEDRCAVASVGGDMREIVIDLHALGVMLDFRHQIIAQDHAGDVLLLQPVKELAGAAPAAGIGGEFVVGGLENFIGLFLCGQNAVDVAAIAFVIMDDREVECFELFLKRDRAFAVEGEAGIGGNPCGPRIRDQCSVPVEDGEFLGGHGSSYHRKQYEFILR